MNKENKAYYWYKKFQKAADKCQALGGKQEYQKMADKFLKEYNDEEKQK